jgi:hypothetical protein
MKTSHIQKLLDIGHEGNIDPPTNQNRMKVIILSVF